MAVVNGQVANQTTFNNAFLSRTQDTSTIGVLTLNNTSNPNSGAQIVNVQRYINELADVDGVVGEGDSSAKVYATNHVLVDGENRKQSLERFDVLFDPVSGHDHDGSNSKKIDASDLNGLNYFRADYFGISVTGASGLSVDISAEMAGKVPGGTDLTAGVVTDPPQNRCEIRNATTETYIEDAGGQRVYGRITESAGVWTLTFFTNEAGVETAHSLSSQDLAVAFKEVFTLATLPTFGADSGILGSFDLTADIVYATDTQAGKVLLANDAPPQIGTVASGGSLGASTAVAREDHTHANRAPEIEYRELSPGEATAKQLTLSATPADPTKVMVDAIGGGAQEYAVDYSVTGSTLSWSGLGLDSIPLSAGDKLRIVYWP